MGLLKLGPNELSLLLGKPPVLAPVALPEFSVLFLAAEKSFHDPFQPLLDGTEEAGAIRTFQPRKAESIMEFIVRSVIMQDLPEKFGHSVSGRVPTPGALNRV